MPSVTPAETGSIGSHIKKILEPYLQPIAVNLGSFLCRYPPESASKRKQNLQKWVDSVGIFLVFVFLFGAIWKNSFLYPVIFIGIGYFWLIRPKFGSMFDKIEKYSIAAHIKDADERRKVREKLDKYYEEQLKIRMKTLEEENARPRAHYENLKATKFVKKAPPPTTTGKIVSRTSNFYQGIGQISTELRFDPISNRRTLTVSTPRSSITANIDGLLGSVAGEFSDLISSIILSKLKGGVTFSDLNFTVHENHLELKIGKKVEKYPRKPKGPDNLDAN